jgi:hypothetical protein
LILRNVCNFINKSVMQFGLELPSYTSNKTLTITVKAGGRMAESLMWKCPRYSEHITV